jgi:hypothetical protein
MARKLKHRLVSSRAYNFVLSRWQDLRFGSQLRCVQNRLGKGDACILFSCIRNEMHRIDFFYRYYKDLGVDHFVFVDNGSTDGFLEWSAGKADVSVWHTDKGYKKAGFGIYWCNYLLQKYGTGKLCVTVDPDEFLVYPHMATRTIKDLGQHLKEIGRPCLHVLMLDAYSDLPIDETVMAPDEDPFAICPYFDRDGYVQRSNYMSGTFVQGGPRLRAFNRDTPREAPALNKMPVVWWQKHYRYQSSAHLMWPWPLNKTSMKTGLPVSGALFHFKFVSSLQQKVEEEMARRQHYGGSREYKRYKENIRETLYLEGISVKYAGTDQLVDLGLVNAGEWV